MDVVAYLASKGWHGRRTGGVEVIYPCFFDCNEPQDSKKRKLYVNAETGLYSCKVCVCEGGTTLLRRHFGDPPLEGEHTGSTRCIIIGGREVPVAERGDVLEAATTAAEAMLGENDDVMDYLMGPRRCLTPEQIVERRIGYAPKAWPLSKQAGGFTEDQLLGAGILAKGENGVYEFHRDVVTIPYIQSGHVVQLRGKAIFGRYFTPVGDPVFLYNSDALKGATEAVLVEGEFDTIMLEGLLATSDNDRVRQLAVVGLAGTGALPEDFEERLSNLKRVFIATDPDAPGRKAAEKLKEKLGDRGVVVEWPTKLVADWESSGKELKDLDWTTWIGKLKANVDEVSELFRPRGRLKSVMQALMGFRNRPTEGVSLGYKGLDSAFLPGLLPGQVMIALAKTGTGKTVFLCNLAYNLVILQKRRILFVTLEMTAEEIWVRLARIYRFYHPFASDESIAQAFSNLKICDANRLDPIALRALIEEFTEEVGDKPEGIFVDYLGYYARGRQGGSQYEKTTDAVMQLKEEAKTYQLFVVTPAQVNRGTEKGKPIDADAARDSGAIEETADLLVALWRADDALDVEGGGFPTGKLHLRILKSRHGNADRTFLLQMGLLSLVLVDDSSVHADRARQETHAQFRGETYDQYLASIRNIDRHLES